MTTNEKTVRSFIAIPLSEEIKHSIANIQSRLKPELPDTRWVRPETMHLTLHFFGDIDHESLEKAASVVVSIESLFRPFPLTFSGLGAFPAANRARVFWVGVESDRLAALHSALAEGLAGAGFPCEQRRFEPHITLGRSRRGGARAGHILSREGDTFAGEMTVDRLVLFESELLPSGALHRPRQTIHFTAD